MSRCHLFLLPSMFPVSENLPSPIFPQIPKMFVKFQHSDANCLRIFNSTKTTPPNVGLSVTPPIHVSSDKIKQKHQVLERPNGARMSKKNGFVKGPVGNLEKKSNFGGSFEAKGGVFNGKNRVLEKEEASKDCYSDNFEGKIERKGNFEMNLIPAVGSNSVVEGRNCNSVIDDVKNGGCGKEKGKKNGYVRELGGKIENYGENQSVGCMPKMQTRCSTKWGRYGGCIPAMLEAVEMIRDLDEALRPWQMSLTNKERSILLKEQQGWERALEIFEWFKRKGCYEVNVIHYNIILRILGKERKWCEVERLWDEMGKRGIKPINSTYGTLIDVYSKGGVREKAVKWLELMNECKMEPDEVTMGIVVQMYKKAGEFMTAEEFYKKWSRSSSALKGLGSAKSRRRVDKNVDNAGVSSYTYNTLIDTYGKAGKVQKARETFEEMLRKGIIPNTVTFNTMIHMYGSKGKLDEVASLMQRMEDSKCSPDTRTYNILISLHARHNDIELAAKYWKKMKANSLEPDAVSYRTLLYAFAIRHMVAEVEELISEMDERGFEIDEFTQSSLTRMYIEAGLLERSWSWFERFHLGGKMTSECYSANIDAYGERGYICQAQKVFDCCLYVNRLTVLEFNVMIKAYGISKKFEEACCLFDSMEKYGLEPDRCGYNSIVQMLASADLPNKALIYLRKMQEVGLVIDCVPYCAVISSYVKLGHLDMAVGLYDEMIGYNVKPDVIVYGVLINAFADTGSVKGATHYVNVMRNLGFETNGVICKSLIKLYTKVGYLKEAEEAYTTLKSFEKDLDVYSSNCMIDLYSERSMVAEAEEIFESLKQKGLANEFTYAMMLCMYKRNGRFVEAFWIAREMRELGLMSELLSYNLVLGFYACDGRYKEAVATFDEMVKSSVHPDDSTFKSLGIILLKCGLSKDAIDKLEKTRKRDNESGLKAWSSTLSSVIYMDDDVTDDEF